MFRDEARIDDSQKSKKKQKNKTKKQNPKELFYLIAYFLKSALTCFIVFLSKNQTFSQLLWSGKRNQSKFWNDFSQ